MRRIEFTRARRLWTAEEDRRLLDYWEDGRTVETVARELGRPAWGIYLRLRRLTGGGIPRGMESFTAACRRTGYHEATLHRILDAHGVRLRAVMSERIRRGGRVRRWFVDPLDVDDAVAAWHEREPVAAAARRIGVSSSALYVRLARIGVTGQGRGIPLRVTDEQIQAAMKAAA